MESLSVLRNVNFGAILIDFLLTEAGESVVAKVVPIVTVRERMVNAEEEEKEEKEEENKDDGEGKDKGIPDDRNGPIFRWAWSE